MCSHRCMWGYLREGCAYTGVCGGILGRDVLTQVYVGVS